MAPDWREGIADSVGLGAGIDPDGCALEHGPRCPVVCCNLSTMPEARRSRLPILGLAKIGMSIIHLVQKIGRRMGLDIQRFHEQLNFDCVHARALLRHDINLVLDVGANTGQFVGQLRNNYGYLGRVISFEPLESARRELEVRASKDPRWEVIGCALGAVSGAGSLNVAGNSQSSSMLAMHPRHIEAAPDSLYVAKESVAIKSLDSIFADLGGGAAQVFLKLDVQGYEMRVLAGALESLKKIRMVRLEMSVLPLYESELLVEDLIAHMRTLQFELVAVEPNFTDPATGALLQIDGLFCRRGGSMA